MFGSSNIFIFIFFFNIYIPKTIAYNTNLKLQRLPFYLGFLLTKEKCPKLLAFHDNSEFCKRMIPVVKKVMKDTGLHIEIINLDNKSDNMKKNLVFYKVSQLLDIFVVPLYYNMKTGKYITGVTSYDNLKIWALDQKPEKNTMLDTPIENDDTSYRITGIYGRLKRFLRKLTQKGEENILNKYKEGINNLK